MDATVMTNNPVIPITAGVRKTKRRRVAVRAVKGPDGIRIQVQLEPDAAESAEASALPASPKEGSETIRFTGCSDAAGGDRRYWIGTDDSVGVQAAEEAKPAEAVVSFSTVEQLRKETSSWQTPQFVRVWNKLPGARPVSRFENRTIAVDRLWRALEDLHQRREKGGAAKTEKKAKTKKKKRGGQSKVGLCPRSAPKAGRRDPVGADGSDRMAGAQRAWVPQREAVEATRAAG